MIHEYIGLEFCGRVAAGLVSAASPLQRAVMIARCVCVCVCVCVCAYMYLRNLRV